MVKVCFIYDPESNERFLEIISKMTPGRSGEYKNIKGVTKIEDADYCVVIDDTTKNVPLDRTIFLQAHPDELKSLPSKPHRILCKDEHTFGEWWLEADYDTLKSLAPMSKSKKLCCIISDAHNIKGHKDRRIFLEKLCKKYPNKIDVYGRIKPTLDEQNIAKCYKGYLGPAFSSTTYWFGKDTILSQYEYSLELEALVSKHYFSERIYDALLMWTIPISWGCPNLGDWLPKDSFYSIDIYKDGTEDEVINFINRDYGNMRSVMIIDSIAKSRELILDSYQLWAKAHDYINNRMTK